MYNPKVGEKVERNGYPGTVCGINNDDNYFVVEFFGDTQRYRFPDAFIEKTLIAKNEDTNNYIQLLIEKRAQSEKQEREKEQEKRKEQMRLAKENQQLQHLKNNLEQLREKERKHALHYEYARDLCKNIKTIRERGYTPDILEARVKQHGAFRASIDIIHRYGYHNIPSGLVNLDNWGIPHLSMQALVIKPKYRELFDAEEIKLCESHLRRTKFYNQQYVLNS